MNHIPAGTYTVEVLPTCMKLSRVGMVVGTRDFPEAGSSDDRIERLPALESALAVTSDQQAAFERRWRVRQHESRTLQRHGCVSSLASCTWVFVQRRKCRRHLDMVWCCPAQAANGAKTTDLRELASSLLTLSSRSDAAESGIGANAGVLAQFGPLIIVTGDKRVLVASCNLYSGLPVQV